MRTELPKNEDEWRATLPPERYQVLREKGTEPPFTGAYVHNHDDGMYHCGACGQALFSSDAKFDSGSGWPSFWKPEDEENIERVVDKSHFMTRTEVRCKRCGGHLGHVFDDGPGPTGKRFCINSCSLDFEAESAPT